ncbi:hypothetical protein SAMN02799630_01721 [Paenibacillus sp. UNCCL117]|uniref:hypothetical protein n=1 Tax=unclassified Paenibacillus TaxID=185978 RepID=UPI0008853EE5|nr:MULTISPECIES: hypothetical protein [unclassified Paenibacillus]SDC91930.1 hypothetical protein SAMN04488602_104208 [Paenibacillus sp. cl123]SFW29195.1 hypothetical protein SAMN02799630_01721 [Paenibacillus sp. UNCCL117]
MKRQWLFLLLIAALLIPASKSWALSCAQLPSVAAAYESYDGVILAHVENVALKKDSNQVRLTVNKSFKGVDSATLIVGEDITWGSLWGPSEPGEDYVFFLRQKDGQWENPLCAPTKKASEASEELEFLKDKELPLPVKAPVEEKPLMQLIDGEAPRSVWSRAAVVLIAAGLGVGIMLYLRKRK